MARNQQNGHALQPTVSQGRQTSTDNQGDDIPDLEYRVRSIFNNEEPPDMRTHLRRFLKATGLSNRGNLFTQAIYLAQHGEALDTYQNGVSKDPEVDWARDPGNVFPTDDPARSLSISRDERRILKLDAAAIKKPPSERRKRWPRMSWPDLRKWHSLPGAVWHIVVVCGIGAMVQGIDQAVVNGAQGLYLAAFDIQIINTRDELLKANSGKAGFINAAPYLCCVVSCWFTPWFNRLFGRRGTIFLCALFSIFFAFAQAFAQTWQQLVVFRLLMGFGIGPKSATIPIYAAETAPANIRGSLVTCWQAFTALGIAIGSASSTILHQWGDFSDEKTCDFSPKNGTTAKAERQAELLSFNCSWNWRIILASPMILPIFLAFLIYFCRESPRWTIAKAHSLQRRAQSNRAHHYYRQAFRDLQVLSRSDLLAARDMLVHYFRLEKEYEATQEARDNSLQTWWGYKWGQMFGKKSRRNHRAITASTVCMVAQQLCGVNVIIYYSNYLIARTNNPVQPDVFNQDALLHTMGFGVVNFVFAIPAYLLIDMMGRRTLLLTTFPVLALSHLIMALASSFRNRLGEQMFLAGFYLFGIFYSPGEGPVPFVYASESMPLSIRAEGMGLVTSINWLFNWAVAFSAPSLFNNLGVGGTFALYSCFCILLWVLILLLVPETRLLTLEQLDIVFEKKSASEFARHAVDSLKYRLGGKQNPGSIYESDEENALTRTRTVTSENGMRLRPINSPSITNQMDDITFGGTERAEGQRAE